MNIIDGYAVRGDGVSAEDGKRFSQIVLNGLCERVRAAEHPCGPHRVLERRHGLAEIASVAPFP